MKIFLAFILTMSSLLAQEESESMRAMRLGCEKQKLANGCCLYAGLLYKHGEEDRAQGYFDKSRKLGNEESCSKDNWEKAPVKDETKTEIISEVTSAAEKPGLKDALASCKDFSQSYLHPTVHGFIVEEKVLGFRDGGCEYQQTMQNGYVSCLLSEEQRLNFEGPEKLLDDGKTCQIVTR